MIVNFSVNLAYRSWFQRMSSPRCRIVGFEVENVEEGIVLIRGIRSCARSRCVDTIPAR